MPLIKGDTWKQNLLTLKTQDRVTIQPSSFQEVKPIWAEHLWPQRKTPIEATSPIQLGGDIDTTLLEKEAVFLKALLISTKPNKSNPIIGVLSGFFTTSEHFRIRGLYVFPDYRRQGVGEALFWQIQKHAAKQDSKKLWSLVRQTAWPFYQSCGFEKISDWTNNYEFGPNCFAVKPIRKRD